MGLLKDTYIINEKKIDLAGVEEQLKKFNEIVKEDNKQELNTRDRVDISLNEYNQMRETIKNMREDIRLYSDFINKLSAKIRMDPERLLYAEVKKEETCRDPMTGKLNLYIVFELENNELI